MQSANEQDYLRSIYELQARGGGSVRTAAIAEELGISAPSVSQMLGKLEKRGLIARKRPYGAVSLTLKGVAGARKVLRRHRLLEVFLVKLLGLKKGFHKEAHAIEHSISDEAEARLERLLRHPKKCPDGREIPSARRSVVSLYDAPIGKQLKIIFSRLESREELARVKSLGLVAGEHVKVLKRVSGGPLVLLVKGSQLALGRAVSSSIYVEARA